MKIIAVGNMQMLLGFMLAGIKEVLNTEDSSVTLQFLKETAKEDCIVIIYAAIYDEIQGEIKELQAKNPTFIPYRFSGGSLRWR